MLEQNNSPTFNYEKYKIPPPEELIAKSVFSQEPIRTGGPFSFIKIESLRATENQMEKMGFIKDKKAI